MRNFDRVFFLKIFFLFGKMGQNSPQNKITGRHVDWALLVISPLKNIPRKFEDNSHEWEESN
jgi:hypothetical protein